MGPYDAYALNREAHNDVMRMHRDASHAIPDAVMEDTTLLTAARESWSEAVALGELYGYRNAQATVLAPTGTISFLMDCDTTGVEPDFSLVKFKELVGGGTMTIVNRTVPMALRTLGYGEDDVTAIVAHIDETNSIVGAPGLLDEHLEVFDVAVGSRAISHEGHIKMMGAVQPFLSARSPRRSTCRRPRRGGHRDAYTRHGASASRRSAIYRDGSKTAQALRTGRQESKGRRSGHGGGRGLHGSRLEKAVEAAGRQSGLQTTGPSASGCRASAVHHPQVLPRRPRGLHHRGHVRRRHGRGDLPDRHRQGGLDPAGMMNSFATSISIALQYGVPLETLVRKFAYMRFEPEGITQNPEIPFAKSMPDYIMRWLASRFLDADVQEDLGILTPEVRARQSGEHAASSAAGDSAGPANGAGNGGGGAAAPAPKPPIAGASSAPTTALTDTPPPRPAVLRGLDLGPACNQCGGMMQRTGSCYTCSSCGNNTGCG
jgi:ribonucleoside-diphosphate reductase alpha chain